MAGLRRRLPRLGHWGFDLVVALAIAGIDLYGAYGEATNPVQGNPTLKLPPVPTWAYALVVVAGLALVFRRRWPLASFVAVLGFTLAYTVLGYDDGAPLLAVAVSLYALATCVKPRTTWVCLGIAVVLTEVAAAAFGPFGVTAGPATVIPWEMVAGVGAGFAVANRRAYVSEIKERAEEAERTREDEARRRVDAERLRIARELHDVVAHSMATINVQAGVAAHLLREQPGQTGKALDAMEAVRWTSKEALGELRGILNLLRSTDDESPTAPVPRLSQLDDLVGASVRAGLPTSVQVVGPARPLPPSVHLAAYRVVQESLTNSLRHAGPARAWVRLDYLTDELVVEISDDGRNASTAVTSTAVTGPSAGNGLRGVLSCARGYRPTCSTR
jgi:signal transduction histidine kinase